MSKKSAKQDQAAALEAAMKVADGKLPAIAKEVNERLERASKAEGQADGHRIAAALRLKEARAIAEDAKIAWKTWVGKNIERSYSDCMKLLQIAGSKDPAKEAARQREAAKEAMARTRKRIASQNPVDKALRAIEALDITQQHQVVSRLAGSEVADAVVAKPAVVDPRVETKIEPLGDFKGDRETTAVDFDPTDDKRTPSERARDDLTALSDEELFAVVVDAVHRMPAKVKKNFFAVFGYTDKDKTTTVDPVTPNAPAADAAPQGTGDPALDALLDIPPALRRKPSSKNKKGGA